MSMLSVPQSGLWGTKLGGEQMKRANLTERAIAAAKAPPGERIELWDADARGLCLRVSDTGKAWVFRYRTADGRQPRMTLGKWPDLSLPKARAKARSLKNEVADGGDPQGQKRAARAKLAARPVRTFDDLADAYLKACETGRWMPKRKRKRARTLEDERGSLRRHIRPALGKLPFDAVDRAAIRKLLADMLDKGIGAQTNRAHAIVRQIFSYAVAEDLAATNPALAIPTPAEQRARKGTYRDEQLAILWAALENPGSVKDAEGETVHVGRPMSIAIQLCALLLQRRGEVAGMLVSELDLDAGTWLVPGERMKAGRPHLVPLPPRAVALIREALTLAETADDEGRRIAPVCVFPSPRDPGKPIRPDSVTHALRRLSEALGVHGLAVHDLRRTGSTALTSERLGFSPFIRSKVLGHATDAGGGAVVSAVHYDANEYVSEKRRALEAWGGLLLEIVGEERRSINVVALSESRG